MKFKKVYDLLSSAIAIESYDKYLELNTFKIESHVSIQKLFDLLKTEVLKESAKENGTQKESTAINKILKQKHLNSRPILQKAIFKDNQTILTDTYTALFLNKKIDGIEYHNEEKKSLYPSFENIIPKTDTHIEFTLQEFKENTAFLKKDEPVKFPLDEEEKVVLYLDKKYIELAAATLKIKNDDIIKLNYTHSFYEREFINNYNDGSYIRPITIKNDNGMALILPMRVEKREEEKNEI